MPHFGTLQDYTFKEPAGDIRGASLYGVSDEKLGTIDDIIFDHSSGQIRYAVVDTGGLLRHKRFLVSAERIHSSESHPDQFQVDMVKEHIERYLPPYDPTALSSEKHWKRYEEQYQRGWHDGVVQHQHGSDRNITPRPDEFPADETLTTPGKEVADISGYDVEPHRMAGKFPEAAPGSSKTHMTPVPESELRQSEARSLRWRRFEDLLRKNRVDIQAKCPSCAPAKDKVA
jgi:PRC-barrel domain